MVNKLIEELLEILDNAFNLLSYRRVTQFLPPLPWEGIFYSVQCSDITVEA